MIPQTILDMLKLKLYIGNKRKKGNAANMVKAHKEIQYIEVGRNTRISRNLINRYQKAMWIDEVNDLLQHRKIEIKSPKPHKLYNTFKKTIMEYTIKYAQIKQLDRDTLY